MNNPDIRIKNLKNPVKKVSNTGFASVSKHIDSEESPANGSQQETADNSSSMRGSSPHKISKNNKLRNRYEDNKNSA